MTYYGIAYTDELGEERQIREYHEGRIRAYPAGEGYRWHHFETLEEAAAARLNLESWEHPNILNLRVVEIPAEQVDSWRRKGAAS